MARSAPGPATALHLPFFGSGKLEYYLAARRPGLKVRGADAFEPVANLHRCYLRRDPVFLRFLVRLVGRDVDRQPGAQRGLAGPRAACSYALLTTASWENGVFRTAAAATALELRASAAAATVECDRAAPGRTGLPAGTALPGAPANLHLR